jgi:hypothetical protein
LNLIGFLEEKLRKISEKKKILKESIELFKQSESDQRNVEEPGPHNHQPPDSPGYSIHDSRGLRHLRNLVVEAGLKKELKHN